MTTQNNKPTTTEKNTTVQPWTDSNRRKEVSPSIDILERDDALIMWADMPGVSKENLDVKVDGDVLSIEGKIHIDVPRDFQMLDSEFSGSLYARSFTLSKELDPDKMKAELKDGLLKLTIPKAEEMKPRKIEVRGA